VKAEVNRRDDATATVHTVAVWRDALSRITGTVPRALCGEYPANPGPDSPACERCLHIVRRPARLLSAYRRLWFKHPAAALRTLFAVVIVATVSVIAVAFTRSALVWMPIGVLIAAATLMRLAPDDDENGGES
jgi:hypothetical protein